MDFGDSLRERRCSTEGGLKPAVVYSRPVTFHYEIQNHTTRMQKLTKAFKVYRLTVLTFVCVLAGILIGLICRYYYNASEWTERHFMYIEMPGELYLRLLKLIIVPLLVSNVILSFGTIHGKLSSYLAKVAGFLYVGSNLMAITVAILLVLLIKPGKSSYHQSQQQQQQQQLQQPNRLITIPTVINKHHHYFNEYHDSINRYREYHPMYYHTDRDGQDGQYQVGKPLAPSLKRNDTAKPGSLLHLVMSHQHPIQQVNHQQAKSQQQYHQKVNNEIQRIALNTKLPVDVVLDMLRNLVPDSLIGATMRQARTRLFAPKELIINKDGTMSPPASKWAMGHEMVDQANIIGLLAISVLTGVVLSHMDEAAKPMLQLCSCVSELSLRIGMMTVNLTPFCIMFLLIGQVARARDLSFIFNELCMYTMTVIVALLVHGFILLPLIYYLVTKKSPLKFFWCMLEALVASFATSSSSATMALVLNCLTNFDLNPVIVRAFGPLGSVFNMNGTAIYEAVGAIFIAQTLDTPMPLTSILLIGLSSAVASLSTTGIPSSGMMTMVIVLNAINLPVLQLSLIYIVDFIIDRFRTVINVWSGSIVCTLINHLCPEHLFEATDSEIQTEKFREMKRRSTLLQNHYNHRKKTNPLGRDDQTPKQVISVTITPPIDSQHTPATTATTQM